jgi:hypothetical protein
MGEQGAVGVVAAKGGPLLNPECLLPPRRDMKSRLTLRVLALLWRTIPIRDPIFALQPIPSFLFIHMAKTEGANSLPDESVWVSSWDIIPTDE